MTDHDAGNDALQSELRRVLTGRTTGSDCPPAARWIALLSRETTAAEAENLRRHLGECAECTATAADARRFLLAMGVLETTATPVSSRRWAIAALAAAAAAAVVAGAAVLLRVGAGTAAPQTPPTVVAFVAAFEPPPPPALAEESPVGGMVYRGATSLESSRSLALALTPYRARQYAAACRSLAEHGQRFPADREARFLAAAACLKAHELDRAEALLASLAAVAGDRRDDAHALLESLRAARRSESP